MAQREVFQGVKILEFGSGAAGPVATRYLADHGATVVRVESSVRPDFLRWIGPHKGDKFDLETSFFFDPLNPNKLSVTINLSVPKGVALAKRLVQWADVVSENFSPGTMGKLGLGYDDLVKVKPDLIMVASSLQGQYGPNAHYPGFGPMGSAISGFNYWAGWPDREPIGPSGTVSDFLAPRFVASAILSALYHRRKTGKGVYLDISQIETCVAALSGPVLEYVANGRVAPRLGNRSPRAAPHGAFPCKGDDRWIAIAVYSDEQWERLCAVLGNGQAASDSRFRTAEARQANVDELERQVAVWTAGRDAYELMRQLQDADVPAGVVQKISDIARDPQLQARQVYQEADHRALGRHPYHNVGFVLSKAPRRIRTGSPLLGEHTVAICKEVLDLSDREIEELVKEGVLK